MGKLTRAEVVCVALAVCFLVLTAVVRISGSPSDGVTVITEKTSLTTEAASSAVSGRININTADAETLTVLSGIGPAKAAAIVSYREEHGPFSDIEDIMNVSGIGPSVFDGIKDYICTEDGE